MVRSTRDNLVENEENLQAATNLNIALLPDEASVEYLKKGLLNGEPEFVKLLCDRIRISAGASELVKKFIDDDFVANLKDDDRILPCAAFLAQFRAQDDNLQKTNNEIVAELIQQTPEDALGWSHLLKPSAAYLISSLTKVFKNEDDIHFPNQTVLAATVLSEFDLKPKQRMELLEIAKPGQFLPIFNNFLKTDPGLVELLSNKAEKLNVQLLKSLQSTAGALTDESAGLPRRISNLTIALFKLGKSKPFWERLSYSKYPEVRSWIINECLRYGIDSQVFFDQLMTDNEIAVKTATIQIIGKLKQFNPFPKLPDEVTKKNRRIVRPRSGSGSSCFFTMDAATMERPIANTGTEA